MGSQTRRWWRSTFTGRFATGHEGSSKKNAQGGSQSIQALSPAHRPIMERSPVAFDQNFSGAAGDFPALLRRKGLLAPAAANSATTSGNTSRKRGNQRRQPQFSLSNSQAACWWQATAARLLATRLCTIARTRFWKSTGTRLWPLPACRRQRGKWRVCSNIRSNIFGERSCRK